MSLVIDTGFVVAAANTADRYHLAASSVLHRDPGPFLVPAPVTQEIDYLLATRVSRAALRAFHADLESGRFTPVCLEPHEYSIVVSLDLRYDGLGLGLADMSVVILGARFNTRRIATLDQGHFRAIEPLQGGAFTLLPFDEEPPPPLSR